MLPSPEERPDADVHPALFAVDMKELCNKESNIKETRLLHSH